MTAVRPQLEKLGLIEYGDKLIAEGFDTWEALCDITESDLNELSVKLGHRRKLQRAITNYHTRAKTAPLRINHGKRTSQAISEVQESSEIHSGAVTDEGPRQKRKYRRHPKPDENAPERPASAYVIFSNYMREQLKGQDLSFTEMAKVVGEKWQVLSADSREVYEKRAATTKEKYNLEISEYKKTENYAAYMEYLADFKAKYAPQDGETTINKQVKLVAGESIGSNNSYDSNNSRNSRRKSVVFTPPAVSAESTLSTQDSRNSSRSNSYASDGHSPRDVKDNKYSSTRGPISTAPMPSQHAFLKTMSRDDTPSSYRDRNTASHYAEPSSRPRSPPSTGIHRAHDLPFSLARPTTTGYHDSPASSIASLPPLAALQHDAHLYAKTSYPSHQHRSALDTAANSPHTPFRVMVDADAPRSIRTLPAPDFRRSSNVALLPPILPPFDGARTTNSLDTLLLAAKVAEKHDMPPPLSS